MIKSQSNNHTKIVSEFSLPKNFTIQRILTFLKHSLSEFEIDFKNTKPEIHLEDDISKQLSLFFQSQGNKEDLLFDFNPRIGVDFGIHISPLLLGTEPIFTIEAKRLSKSHYDYVKGDTGGIERFKREKEGFGKHLKESAMIGYIQDECNLFWEAKINKWIENLIQCETDIIWNNDDKLISGNNICDYLSTHSRISCEPITLYHFWISLN